MKPQNKEKCKCKTHLNLKKSIFKKYEVLGKIGDDCVIKVKKKFKISIT